MLPVSIQNINTELFSESSELVFVDYFDMLKCALQICHKNIRKYAFIEEETGKYMETSR